MNFHVFFLDFLDTYGNLTLKTLAMLYWVYYRVKDRGLNPDWVFKVDDDNLVDIFNFEDYLHKMAPSAEGGNEIHCYVREDDIPDRSNDSSKW